MLHIPPLVSLLHSMAVGTHDRRVLWGCRTPEGLTSRPTTTLSSSALITAGAVLPQHTARSNDDLHVASSPTAKQPAEMERPRRGEVKPEGKKKKRVWGR